MPENILSLLVKFSVHALSLGGVRRGRALKTADEYWKTNSKWNTCRLYCYFRRNASPLPFAFSQFHPARAFSCTRLAGSCRRIVRLLKPLGQSVWLLKPVDRAWTVGVGWVDRWVVGGTSEWVRNELASKRAGEKWRVTYHSLTHISLSHSLTFSLTHSVLFKPIKAALWSVSHGKRRHIHTY